MRAHQYIERIANHKNLATRHTEQEYEAACLGLQIQDSKKFWCEEAENYPACNMPELMRLPYPVCSFDLPAPQASELIICCEPEKTKTYDPAFYNLLSERLIPEIQREGGEVRFVASFLSIFFEGPPQHVFEWPAKFLFVAMPATETAGEAHIAVEEIPLPGEGFESEQDIRLAFLEHIQSSVCNTLGLLNCENIQTEIVKPSPKLNLKRSKNNRPPLFSYHTLRLPKSPNIRYEGYVAPGDGESRRLHWVRGHIRRLNESRATWVRACLRGDANKGMADKGYRIKVPNSHDIGAR